MAPAHNENWRPAASTETLRRRAQLLARIRDYFEHERALEVETPLISHSGTTDPHLHSYAARSLAPGTRINEQYLHTSPEFAMKRLLASGTGSIYQICKVFRAGEQGRLHNAEFTMVEWYRVDIDYHALMKDVAALVLHVLDGTRPLGPVEKITYHQAFERYAGADPHRATASDLAQIARTKNIHTTGIGPDDRDSWRDLLLTHLVEPNLGQNRLTFLYDYPASAAALARIRPGSPPVAERFELYLDGMELANGFQELSDAAEQRARFDNDRRERDRLGMPLVPHDEHLLTALAHGLPNCSGVALGFDRLVMSAVGAKCIDDVLAFPTTRA